MDIYELVKKLKALQGLTDDEKAALIGLLRSHKKYGLVWEDKSEAVETELEEKMPTLTEVKERAIVGDTKTEHYPNHILIEGDNLHALTALSYTHAGKIDVIYIDPPYNTGNKDFVYNDKFIDKEDGYRNSKWLSFMSKRLRIAKDLLSPQGVIVVSIDNNEQAALTLLCDEIFGSRNQIAIMPRITKSSGKTTDKIAMNHDFLLFYAKNVETAEVIGLPHNDSGFRFSDEYVSTRGKYKLNQTLDYDSLQYSDSLDYPIDIEGYVLYPGGDYNAYLKRKSGEHRRADWEWRWSKDKYQFGLENGFVVLKKNKKSLRIYTKTYQFASIEKTEEGKYYLETKDRTKAVQSILFIENIYSNDNAKKELGKFFNPIPFDYPKPTSILKTFLRINPKAKTVLDFFAGSGTSMDATMQLNAEDGGHRQCILVTNNENNICEEVTYERNKRVINGYTTPKGEQVEGLHQNNLRYYRTDFVGRNRTVKNMRALVEAATDMLCIKENLYQEEPKLGSWRRLPKQVARRFTDGNRQMLVIYKEDNIEEIVDAIYDMELKEKIKIYVFSPDRDPYEDEFADVEDKVNLCALPAAIYDAYMRVLPRQKDKRIEIAPETDENREEAWTLDEEELA